MQGIGKLLMTLNTALKGVVFSNSVNTFKHFKGFLHYRPFVAAVVCDYVP